MTLARLVTLEPVLVAALLHAHLAVPPQLAQALGFDAVADRFRREKTMLWHGGGGGGGRSGGGGGGELWRAIYYIQGPRISPGVMCAVLLARCGDCDESRERDERPQPFLSICGASKLSAF